MATSIIMSLIIAAIIILVLTLLVLCIRQPQQAKMRNDKVTLEMLSYSPIFKKAVDAIIPPAEDREFRKNERLISDSGYNMSMRTLYFLKLVIPIMLLIIFLSIYFINRQVYVDAVITDSLTKNVDVLGSSANEKEKTSEEKSEFEQAKRDTYDVVNSFVDKQILKSEDAIAVKQAIQEAFLKNNLATESDVYYQTEEMYNKMLQVEKAKQINPVTIIFIVLASLVGFIVPDVFLTLARMIRYQSFDNEIIALEMLTILVGSIENVTVKEILRILSLNSKAFKKNFEKALLEYPIDFEQALINLGDSSKNKDFQALISTLRQCATSDKYSALQTLQRRRISRKEYRKLMEEKKIETKMYIGFILLIPVLFFLAKLLLSPWQDLMNSSGLM